MNGLLKLAGLGEAAFGFLVLARPPTMVHLLFGAGAEVTGAAAILARVAGLALIGLGVACWPSAGDQAPDPGAVRGLFVYTWLVAAYFVVLGLERTNVGPLLWPALILHVLLGLVLVRGLRLRVHRTSP